MPVGYMAVWLESTKDRRYILPVHLEAWKLNFALFSVFIQLHWIMMRTWQHVKSNLSSVTRSYMMMTIFLSRTEYWTGTRSSCVYVRDSIAVYTVLYGEPRGACQISEIVLWNLMNLWLDEMPCCIWNCGNYVVNFSYFDKMRCWENPLSIHHNNWSMLSRFDFKASALMLRLYCSQLMIKWRLYRKLCYDTNICFFLNEWETFELA